MGEFVRLVDPGGTVVRVRPQDASYYEARGYTIATEEDVKRHKASDKGLQTFAESAGAGAIDAATALPRIWSLPHEAAARGAAAIGVPGAESVASEISAARNALGGRETIRGAVGLAAEATGGEAGAAEQAYQESARARAEENPTAATAGYIAGQLPFALALPQAAGRGMVAQGAAEGFVFGAGGAGENAFLRGDDEVTAEEMLAEGGFGTVLGGLAGGAMHGVSSGLGAVFGRGSRAALTEGAERGEQALARAAAKASDGEIAEALSRATGEQVDPALARGIWNEYVAPTLGRGSELASGAEGAFVARGLSDSAEGRIIREVIRNPDAVLDEARGALRESLAGYRESMDAITEISRNAGMKESAWRKMMRPDMDEMARAASAQRASRIIDALEEVDASRVAANADGIVDDLELAGANRGVWNRIHKQTTRTLAEVGEAGDAAEAMVKLDSVKRMMQKNILQLRKRASAAARSGADAYPLEALAARLEGVQEQTRKFLEDSAVWGDAGKAQQRINAAWAAKLDPHAEANNGFRGMWQKVGDDYGTGRAVFRVNEEGVDRFVGKVGRKVGGQEYADMVRQLDADEALVDAIGESVGRDSDAYKRFAEETAKMRRTLEDVKTRGGYANQFRAVVQASNGGFGNIGATGLAYAVGGAPGAALANLVSNPAQMLRIGAAVEATARRVDEKLNGHLGRMFSRSGAPAPRIPKQLPPQIAGMAAGVRAGTKATSKAAKRAAVPAAVRIFQGKHQDRRDAYDKRTTEIVELTSNAAMRHERLTRAAGGAPSSTVAAALVGKQARGLEYLRSKLPDSLQNPDSLTPHLERRFVSDTEIDKFARYWSAVVSPMSVLEDLERGRCTLEQIEALKSVYPRLYQQVRQKTLLWLAHATERPPYELRKRLDMLLDLEGKAEPSMSAGFIQRQQQRWDELKQRQPPQGRQAGAAPKLAQQYESPLSLDELENA